MSERHFNNWFEAYLQYTEHSEAPEAFHFWTGVSVVAGALRRRVWIDMGYFQWTPNFYIIFVAPPGIVSKSITASIGMKLLREIPGIHFGPDVVTWQALVQSMAESTEQVEIEGIFYPMSCITISSSEFGTFLNPNDREMVDVLTSLWDGQIGAWKKATKTQGADTIQNPWINVVACTTPSWIAGNMPEYIISGGFMSRCIVIFADTKRKLVAYPKDEMPEDFSELERKLIHDLELISMMFGEYHLSKEAKNWGVNWYEEHYKRILSHAVSDQIQGYMARKQTHVHKLAMVLSAAKHTGTTIELAELKEAVSIVTNLETDMQYIFQTISASPETQHASELLTIVRRYKSISQANLFRLLFHKMTYSEFKQALESAVAADHILMVSDGAQLLVKAKDEKSNQHPSTS